MSQWLFDIDINILAYVCKITDLKISRMRTENRLYLVHP